MKVYNRLNDWDKIVATATILCFIFWVLAKIPILWDFVLFGVIYELGVLISVVVTVLCTVYFFIKWVNVLTLKKIYLYGFLLGVITLLIMRLVYSITLDGITWMPNYKN
ncbi:hypothetical protein [Paenimyroides baculatum]|uniref:Uncharacterized protein n=1 Tax=Paenimyroides baculatum TaxID=2608000 RepID=A0A5M6CG09_9FLAO|nr:hypothetical protein [Paenimyroides baculatum]KAA5534081.1 hypothetical protein F0460_10410 [Paenimyroides baculatum]